MSSLYAQITTHCNMSCAHCSFGCHVGNPDAKHMSLATYRRVLGLVAKTGFTLCLGGGEPTVHPEFPRMLLMALGNEDIDAVWMATNGKVADYAVALARLAQQSSRFEAVLSSDPYHDPVEDRVHWAFEDAGLEIRDVTQSLTGVANQGSARRNGVGDTDHCACQVPRITPEGEVFMCGCEESVHLGHIDEDLGLLAHKVRMASSVMDYNDVCGRDFSSLEDVLEASTKDLAA